MFKFFSKFKKLKGTTEDKGNKPTDTKEDSSEILEMESGVMIVFLAFVIFTIALVINHGVTTYFSSDSSASRTSEYKELDKALKALKDYEDTYIITTQIAGTDTTNYIEVVMKDGSSYTEYPIDSNGKVGVVDSDATSYNYLLTDWSDKNNLYAFSTSDSENATVTTLPKSYKDAVSDRVYMYLPEIMKNISDVSKEKKATQDIGNGEEEFQIYKAKLPASTVKDIVGVGTQGLYKAIAKDYSDDENIKNLADYYVKNMNMDLTFSDANVTFGVADGIIKYVNIETGGLGTRLNLTRAVITDTSKYELREKPDVSKSVDYVKTQIKETADYVATFDSIEDAMMTLNNGSTDTSTELPTTDTSGTDNK